MEWCAAEVSFEMLSSVDKKKLAEGLTFAGQIWFLAHPKNVLKDGFSFHQSVFSIIFRYWLSVLYHSNFLTNIFSRFLILTSIFLKTDAPISKFSNVFRCSVTGLSFGGGGVDFLSILDEGLYNIST